MDLLDFEAQEVLYFDEPLPESVQHLLDEIASGAQAAEELSLLRAYFLAPEHLTVLVALFRFFFFCHRLEDALVVSHHALRVSGRRLEFPQDWQALTPELFTDRPMTLVRFYLFALKGCAYLNLRLGHIDTGKAILKKLMTLDLQDRLGAAALLDVIEAFTES